MAALSTTASVGEIRTPEAGRGSYVYRGAGIWDLYTAGADLSAYRTATDQDIADSAKEVAAEKGVADGYAPLGADAKIPAAYLPSFVDDVIEAADAAALPGTGLSGKIYVTIDTGKTYRWGGSAYAEISPAPGSTDEVSEGVANLYYTNERASASAPVQSVAGRDGNVELTKADVGLGSVDNTSDAAKPISGAVAAALATKALPSDIPAYTEGATAPPSPALRDEWRDSVSGAIYRRVNAADPYWQQIG